MIIRALAKHHGLLDSCPYNPDRTKYFSAAPSSFLEQRQDPIPLLQPPRRCLPVLRPAPPLADRWRIFMMTFPRDLPSPSLRADCDDTTNTCKKWWVALSQPLPDPRCHTSYHGYSSCLRTRHVHDACSAVPVLCLRDRPQAHDHTQHTLLRII